MGNVEIMSRVERRRKWTPEEKADLLAEVEAAGGQVRIVARRHRISPSLLYKWRATWKTAAAVMRTPETTAFIPLGVLEGPTSPEPAMLTAAEQQRGPQARASEGTAGGIEIALPNGARVSVDAFVNEKALARVLRAMKGAT